MVYKSMHMNPRAQFKHMSGKIFVLKTELRIMGVLLVFIKYLVIVLNGLNILAVIAYNPKGYLSFC